MYRFLCVPQVLFNRPYSGKGVIKNRPLISVVCRNCCTRHVLVLRERRSVSIFLRSGSNFICPNSEKWYQVTLPYLVSEIEYVRKSWTRFIYFLNSGRRSIYLRLLFHICWIENKLDRKLFLFLFSEFGHDEDKNVGTCSRVWRLYLVAKASRNYI